MRFQADEVVCCLSLGVHVTVSINRQGEGIHFTKANGIDSLPQVVHTF